MPQWQVIKYFIKDILTYIYVEGILCLSDRELNIL
jgi:hypothetical protein